MKGVFVIFEGIDGSGKSTTVQKIAQRLELSGIAVAMLREPTEKTDASREIRRILRTTNETNAKIDAELLELFYIDRLWDLRHQIEPALKHGTTVLLDRYYLSTAAYQARDLVSVDQIMESYLVDQKIIQPDLLVHLDLPVAQALARLTARAQRDVFETESRLTRVQNNYSHAIKTFREKLPDISTLSFSEALTANDFDSIVNRIESVQVKVAQ